MWLPVCAIDALGWAAVPLVRPESAHTQTHTHTPTGTEQVPVSCADMEACVAECGVSTCVYACQYSADAHFFSTRRAAAR